MDDGGCPVKAHRWMMASREHRRARASHSAQSTFPLAAHGASCFMVSMMAMRLLCRLGSATSTTARHSQGGEDPSDMTPDHASLITYKDSPGKGFYLRRHYVW